MPPTERHPLHRALAALLLLAGLGFAPAPAVADDDAASAVAEARRRASSDPDQSDVLVGEPSQVLVTDWQSTPVAPGVLLTTFDRLDARGWVRGQLLAIDLATPGLQADAIFAGTISGESVLSRTANDAGAIAAVNGDFFDINATNAAFGAVIRSGELVKGPIAGWHHTVGVGTDGLARLAEVFLEGTIETPAGAFPLAGLNQHLVPAGGIGLFTSLWGADTRTGAVGGATNVREVIVQDGLVVSVESTPGAGQLPEGAFALVGRDAGADSLAGLQIGDMVSVSYAPRTDVGELSMAVGGNVVLMRNGNIPANLNDTTSEPRTAVGISADGRRMWLLTVDGRQSFSRGMTYRELATFLRDQGAHAALNLDGGGSSTLVARLPGDDAVTVHNSPSDGHERSVPNGIGLFAAPGSGSLAAFRVTPVLPTGGPARVFPGLSRTFRAAGHDETYAPVDATPSWRALPADVGAFEAGGVLRARKSGRAIVEATAGAVRGNHELLVLGALARIETAPARLGLAPSASGAFHVTGLDAEGFSAPIEPRDIDITYDPSVVSIVPTESGGFRVTPQLESGATLVRLQVDGKEAFLPVTVGLKTLTASSLETKAGWTAVPYPSPVTASLTDATGYSGGGVKLTYGFTGTTATRAAYFRRSPSDLELPGEPQRLGVQVKGDGKGAWLRCVVYDANNTKHTLNLASSVTWTDWRYVETVIPPGVRFPLRLREIYPVETNRARQYSGSLVFDEIVVKVAQELAVPAPELVEDPLVVQQGALESTRWRFAVMADSQFVAAAPYSPLVEAARRGLREILAAEPDFLVIPGDLVDTAWPEDFELAHRVLAEEVGGRIPVYYVPGNHEIMGPGNLDNFREAFGPNRGTFDHRGTRFILLDSSTGSLRTSDFPQIVDLQRLLGEAATDRNVKNVVVSMHHPTHDPLPTKNSQLSDRQEAALLEKWFAEFRTQSGGKGIAFISGHAHTADVRRVDGVPYVVMPSNGKSPYGPVDAGGFNGWALFGVDSSPSATSEWLRMEVRPQLDSAEIQAPSALDAGEIAFVTATGTQYPGRVIPMRYPASVTWSGSANVHVGSGPKAQLAVFDPSIAATFDPATGELVALRPGVVELRVESNGTTASASVTITP